MLRLGYRRWNVVDCGQDAADELVRALGCSHFAARLLCNRGLTTPEAASAFLHPSPANLPDPLLLPDAQPAIDRIAAALAAGERIAVHGDYDVDGVTSAALWKRLLDRLGGHATAHVPHRRRDGYDMRSSFVAQACQDGARLIVTTDCGIRRIDEVEEARKAGIDVIVTDHHQPGPELPRAVAVVNPRRADSRYPFTDLAGVGVAFRLGEALVRHLGKPVAAYRRAYSDLAALGTVADIMPILGDNRIIVKEGLENLRETRKEGLRALLRAAGLQNRPLTAHHVSFGLGPRLNAVGRLDDAAVALALLLTTDTVEAEQIAATLEAANYDRRQEQARIMAEALQQAGEGDLENKRCLVLAGHGWHSGIIGPVASKVVERYNRPAILIAIDDETGVGRGSARSIRAFHIYDAISACSDCLSEFGGHAHAAGFSIAAEHIDDFAHRVNAIALERLTEEDLHPELAVDAELAPNLLTPDLLHDLRRFEPWGRGNEPPLVAVHGLEVISVARIGKEQNHLKLVVRAQDLDPTEAVMWRGAELAERLEVGQRLDLCCRIQANAFGGTERLELVVEDMRAPE